MHRKNRQAFPQDFATMLLAYDSTYNLKLTCVSRFLSLVVVVRGRLYRILSAIRLQHRG